MKPDPRYYISKTRQLLDEDQMVAWIRGAYWGQWLTEERIRSSFRNSAIIGVFDRSGSEPRQVGFIRMLSDCASVSVITDLYVDEAVRGQGLGRMLMDYAVNHSMIAKTICVLRTRVPEFYVKWNFVPIGGDVMQRAPTR